MKLYYSVSSSGNFGDDMNEWFWDELLSAWRQSQPDVTLFGIGTILGRNILNAHDRVLVCGSGAGYGAANRIDRDKVEISWVRGPRTAALIGVESSLAITDPACMAATMPQFSSLPRGVGGAIFIPHRSTARLDIDWNRLGRHASLRVVLPTAEAHAVIAEIASASLVVTESLHGAIVADAFRVPWVPVRISNQFNDFKWQDWAESVEVSLQIENALAIPRKLWFLLRDVKAGLRSTKVPLPARQSACGPDIPDLHAARTSTDLGETGRRRVKGLARSMSPFLELALGRDLRRASCVVPHLSPEGVVADRIDRIRDRLALVQRQIYRDLGNS